ncbi:hypothetical protein RA28_19685 [Ruegeria sp. ANG-S4]|uniref:hypothetical protein n=1 Tax=Ruegeria sp. ANG-S4 TaxID=1577904 RepID=UPI00057E2E2D|nr:hypothetical protein [Ruegeria sp. ANG-S4]KIC43849.1 hypothetical protein RA28_19685 [Ruegeria sp. ANG-S4]
MTLPPFLNLPDEAAYRAHFNANFVHAEVTTHHGIRVHFKEADFGHAFFESTQRNGVKDQFSADRSQRMDWILHTINDANADWYKGWIRRTKTYDSTRSVAVACGDFVVVLRFHARRDGQLAANFMTCYFADNSIGKIRQSPAWALEECRTALGV